MNYKKLLQSAIDLHVHVGPEIIPRKFNLVELAQAERGKLKAVAVKSHFNPTTDFKRPKMAECFIIDSITLNNYVGGFNAEAVIAVAKAANRPIIIWFPTISAKNFLRGQECEIPKEWIGGKLVNNRKASQIKQLCVLDTQGNIKLEVKEVLKAIKDYNCILATGHISWQECVKLVKTAQKEFGIYKIVITHPVYQRINMPLSVQKKMAQSGAFIEQCYSMYSIDKIPIPKIAQQIKALDAKNCILSSDVGQTFSQDPSEALADFMSLLQKQGISEKELKTIMIDNPLRLISP